MIKGKKKTGLIIAIVAIIVIAIVAIGLWFTQIKMPYDKVMDEYNPVYKATVEKNSELETSIQSAQDDLDQGNTPLDVNTVSSVQIAVGNAQEAEVQIPEHPGTTAEAQDLIDKYSNTVDYTSVMNELAAAQKSYDDSCQSFNQVNNPSSSFVESRLVGLANITAVEAATENRDPNKQMNKDGGYTAAVYFTSDLVNPSKVSAETEYGNGPVALGTSAGGCIEVFKTADDAQKRCTYLSAFDGAGAFNSGSHTIIGTVLIRTSNYLTASQQTTITNEIVSSLTAIK
ncbi:MAG: hypothetical protein LKF61_05090 [Eggerthellaceae bacterium]|jgi:hypothetical protein|nr:hypothetical protein [Eggerthellaceae bacterium]MCH4220531.1 hypothetical protein [Eggerthellaceae bacterium]